MDGVNTVRQVFGFRKTVFIAHEQVALGVICVLITSGGFQIHFKFRTDFRCFDLGGAVVAVFNDGNFSFGDGFQNIHGGLVIFDRVFLGLRAY